MSRAVVPNSNHCIRVGTACDKGVGRSKPPPGTAGVRKEGSFTDVVENGPIRQLPRLSAASLGRTVTVIARHGDEAIWARSGCWLLPCMRRYSFVQAASFRPANQGSVGPDCSAAILCDRVGSSTSDGVATPTRCMAGSSVATRSVTR